VAVILVGAAVIVLVYFLGDGSHYQTAIITGISMLVFSVTMPFVIWKVHRERAKKD
jgi:Na+/melibiose symporter-like transporter